MATQVHTKAGNVIIVNFNNTAWRQMDYEKEKEKEYSK
jgi:hypothetical protein